MGSIKVSFDLLGEPKLAAYFDHVERVPDDWRPAWEEMAPAFWSRNAQTFASQGPGWRPLAPRYAKWKAKHYPGAPILVRTGALLASLTGPDAKESIYEVYPTRMVIGTGVHYAIYHQTGSIKVADRPPKRSPVVIDEQVRVSWRSTLAKWLQSEFDWRG